jgi:peptide/nickel transport system permease protein
MITATVTIVVTVAVIFIITRRLGDPVAFMLGPRATPEQIDFFQERAGFNDSLVVQFLNYLRDLLSFDFGNSIITGRRVSSEVFLYLPATIELVIFATLLGLFIFVPLGIFAASRKDSLIARVCDGIVTLGVSIPSFWLGLFLIFIFYYILEIAPPPFGRISGSRNVESVTGFLTVDSLLASDLAALTSAISYLVLPCLTLALTSCVPILKLTKEMMTSVLNAPYIHSARNLGLAEGEIIWKLAFKNALIPVLTLSAMTFGFLIGGSVLVETVFSWPGIGLYAVQSMYKLDYAPVLAVTIIATVTFVLVYFVVDVVSAIVDPRIRAKS